MRTNRDHIEIYTHSFIIKIWPEEADQVTWRGHITHVPNGERRYVQHLDDITAFIARYLEEMGIELGIRWRIRRSVMRWLTRL